MSRPMRFAVHLLAGLFLAGTLALGWAWHRDRSRPWEEPRWTPEEFVPLRAGQRAARGGQATWMVTVNLRCPRCLATLRRIAAVPGGTGDTAQLAALIVDTPARPGAAAVLRLPPMPVWWDRDGVWRRRWGHRLYGELIRFDAAGRHLGTLAAEDALDALGTASRDDHAPAHRRKGGT
jgi:hypothetical protein